MQRYRVNFRLLISLAVGGVLLTGGSYALWRYQVKTNADRLLTRSESAEAEADYETAIDQMRQYVRLRQEEESAWIRLANLALAAREREGAQMEDHQLAYSALVEAVQRTDDAELRRELVDMQIGFAPHVALENVQALLERTPNDTELQVLEARCLFSAGKPSEAERACERMVGYNAESGTLDSERATAPREPEAYAMLAGFLLSKDQKPELVDTLIEQIVAMNPDSHEAYLQQYRLLSQLERQDEALASLAQAAELNPDDAEVLLRQGLEAQRGFNDALESEEELEIASLELAEQEALQLLQREFDSRVDSEEFAALRSSVASAIADGNSAASQKEMASALRKLEIKELSAGSLRSALEPLQAYYDAVLNEEPEVAQRKLSEVLSQLRACAYLAEALRYFSTAMEKYPDKPIFIERTARVQIARGDLPTALATVVSGLKRFGLERAVSLSILKVSILFGEGDFPAIRNEVAELRKKKIPELDALADFHEARIMAVEENWNESARELHRVRPQLSRFPDLQALACSLEGFCHERLARFDLAREAYSESLKLSASPMARAGLERAERQLATPASTNDSGANRLDLLVKQQLDLPPAQQDWSDVDALIDQTVADQDLPETRSLLYRAQVLVQRAQKADDSVKPQLFKEARELISRAYMLDKNDRTVMLAAIRLISLEPGTGPAQAIKLYNKVLPDLGDDAAMRELLAELLVANGAEQLPEQLMSVTQGIEDWTPGQQALVWSAVGSRFKQLGMAADARDCLMRASELAPTSLPTATFLFDVAMQMQDSPAMDYAQSRILEIVGSEKSPEYVLTEVKRRIVGLSNGVVSREEALEGREMLDDAIAKRPTWHELYVLRGQFAAMLDRDPDAALEYFDRALQYGRANLNAVVMQVNLLAELGRFVDARKAMTQIPAEVRGQLLERTGPVVLMEVGETEEALEMAQNFAAASPKNAAIQTWLGDLATRMDAADVADQAYHNAIALNSTDPTVWSRLVNLYIQTRQGEKLLDTLREAHLSLDAEYLPPLTAKYYELYGRWDAAEDIYLSLYRDRLDDPAAARKMAEFYRAWSIRGEKDAKSAAPYLNRILRAVDAGTLSADHPDAAWARQQASEIFSRTRSFQDSLKAEELLSTGAGNAVAQGQDRALLATVLGQRLDPASHLKAVELLKEIRAERGSLTPEQGILLGTLLYQVGRWSECQSQMEFAISQHPQDVSLRSSYVAMLIDKRESQAAQRWIGRLEELEGGKAIAAEYRVRLAARNGDPETVRRIMRSMTPRLSPTPTEKQLNQLVQVARLALSVEDHEVAVTLLKEYLQRTNQKNLEAAGVIAQFGNIDEGLKQLEELFPDRIDDVLRVAISVYRLRRDEAPQKLDDAIGDMVRRALRDDPESAVRLELQAEALEIAERFDEAIAAYEKLLARDDVPTTLRASALNNLAYVLAITDRKDRLDDALEAVNEAAEILGPLSDILDTRAVVLMAQGQYEQAIADLELATLSGATPSKHFHHARALLLAGKKDLAAAAWKKGVQEGLDEEAISSLEQEAFQETSRLIEPLLGS